MSENSDGSDSKRQKRSNSVGNINKDIDMKNTETDSLECYKKKINDLIAAWNETKIELDKAKKVILLQNERIVTLENSVKEINGKVANSEPTWAEVMHNDEQTQNTAPCGSSKSNNNNTETANTVNTTSKSVNRNSKIPPIVVDDNGKKGELVSELLKITDKITFSPINASKFRVLVTDNLQNFDKVLACIKAKNMNGNTYTPKEQKPITLLVRNLEFNTAVNEDTIRTEYTNSGFTIVKVLKWSTKTMKEKERFFWLVQFDANTDMRKLYEKRLICNVSVRYEKPSSNLELMQCRNCKQFQHSHTSCFRPFRCIKCPNTHGQGQCDLPSSSKPYCVNCKGDHPANAPICPYYLRLLNRIKGTNTESSQNNPTIEKPKPNEFITVGKKNKPIKVTKPTLMRAHPKINYARANPGTKQGRLGKHPFFAPQPTPNKLQTTPAKKQLTVDERISRIEENMDRLLSFANGFLNNT